jgi:NAD(P)-dependent dehydrogenase (short-subunit alcohol dehydrogenase family)
MSDQGDVSPTPGSGAAPPDLPLSGRVALVAGATRGASRAIALELARQGAYVYATGRSSRRTGPSEYGLPQTIDDVGDSLRALGRGVGLRVDHLDPDEVRALVERIDVERGRLDLLVIGLFGADQYAQFGHRLWEHDLPGGLRMLEIGIDSHVITLHAAVPLLLRHPGGLFVELTDGTTEYNRAYRHQAGLFYDLTKAAAERLVLGMAHELGAQHTAVGVTPGWLRSEVMLGIYGVTEDTWRDAVAKEPHFAISETPQYVARGVAALAADLDRHRFSGTVLTSYGLAERYDLTDDDGSRPDAWRYIVEVMDAGRTADTTGYR